VESAHRGAFPSHQKQRLEITTTLRGQPPIVGPAAATTKMTLLAIEPLQTVGRQFPFTCKIGFRETKVPAVKTVLWYAPNFQVVRTETYTNDVLDLSLEMVRIVSEP
jgi:hypothetical protein